MYSRHRFPSEIISYCVWLYYTFPLSYQAIEKMMLYRGIEVTYETYREWCQKFGQQYANQLRRKRAFITDKWHLDEVVVTIKKQQYYLWWAVDSEGNVLEVLLQRHRDTEAAKRFFRKLLKKQGFVPRVSTYSCSAAIVTDKLKSYEAAKKQVMKNVEHRTHKGLNNRAENSHQPTRVRERRMRRFKSLGKPNDLNRRIWTNSRPLPPETTPTDCTPISPGTAPTISRLARSRLLENCCVKLSEPDD